MKRVIAVVFAVSALFYSTLSFAGGPFGTIHVGNWNGGAYTNDNDNTFSHCAAGSNYVNGTAARGYQ
jgi:hypothetical protein